MRSPQRGSVKSWPAQASSGKKGDRTGEVSVMARGGERPNDPLRRGQDGGRPKRCDWNVTSGSVVGARAFPLLGMS